MKTTDSVMREKEVWIKIPDWIYYTGKVTVEYQRPDGELYRSEFHPGDYEDALSHSLAEARREWVEEMRGKVNDMKYRGIAHSDLEARRHNALLEKIEDLLTGDNPEEEK